MADVFISYAREDRVRAEQIARGLQGAGLDVFWDNEIPPGQTWADYIESKLTQCKALIVLWSATSTKSQWVREEARMGRDKGLLIPAMLDNSPAPFGFGEVQAANLANWNGQADHPDWRRFLAAVSSAAGAPARPATVPPPMPPPPRAPSTMAGLSSLSTPKVRGPWPWIIGGGVAVIGVLMLIGALAGGDKTASPPAPAMVQAPEQQQVQQQVQQQAPEQGSPQQAANAGGDSPQAIILAQLQQAQSVLSQQGFQQLGQPSSGGLQQGQTWDVPVDLYAGIDYRVIGVCDRDCNDLDLVLFDPQGILVVQDTSNDDHPLLGIQPTTTGRFNMRVQMYHCSVAPCYYAVALFARRPAAAPG